MLKKAWKNADGKHITTFLVVPKECVPRVLEVVHGIASGVHLGVNANSSTGYILVKMWRIDVTGVKPAQAGRF